MVICTGHGCHTVIFILGMMIRITQSLLQSCLIFKVNLRLIRITIIYRRISVLRTRMMRMRMMLVVTIVSNFATRSAFLRFRPIILLVKSLHVYTQVGHCHGSGLLL